MNCPHNPIVRTASADETWWSRGHATPVQGPAGDWWMAYHGYENGYRTLGRQMLLEPFVWDADSWPRATGGDLSRPLPMPRGGRDIGSGVELSGPFEQSMIGTRWAFFAPSAGYLDRVAIRGGTLTLFAESTGPANSSPLAFIAGDHSYEVTVDVELQGEAQAGLLLFYDRKLFAGVGAEGGKLHTYKVGQEQGYPPPGPSEGRRFSMRMIMLRFQGASRRPSFRHSRPGAWQRWVRFQASP